MGASAVVGGTFGLLAVPDRVLDAALSGGTWDAALPVTNLGTMRLDQPGQTAGLDPTTTYGAITYDRRRIVGGVALVGHNLGQYGMWRYRTASAAPGGWTGVAPTSIQSTTYPSGTVADIDEDPFSPDANWLSDPTLGLTHDTTVRFPTTGSLNDGTDCQIFVARVRRSDISNPNQGSPISMELWQSGVKLRDLTCTPSVVLSTDTDGEIVWATWSKSDLSDTSGAEVECRIVQDDEPYTLTGEGIQALGAVRWYADQSSAATYDTGMMAAWPAAATALDTDTFDWIRWTAHHELAAADQADHYAARVDLLDPANPDGYISVQRVVAGPAIGTTYPIQGGDFGVRRVGEAGRTDAGYRYARVVAEKRYLDIDLRQLPEDETIRDLIAGALRRLMGVDGGVVVPRPDASSADVQALTAFFAAVDDDEVSAGWSGPLGRMDTRVTLEEV